MALTELNENWIRTIDGKYTFCGVLEEYYEDCAIKWVSPNTRQQYNMQYNGKILPYLEGHDSKTIGEYVKDDFDKSINQIIRDGQNPESAQYTPYADSTIQHFRHLIYTVVNVAVKHGLCEDILWGSPFTLPGEGPSSGDSITELVKLKKSFSVAEEYKIADKIFSNPIQRGQEMGLLLMFGLGLRNAEACGANFGDIVPMRLHPDCKVLRVYKTTIGSSNSLQAGGKTKNADRILPIPEVLCAFFDKRKEFLESLINAKEILLKPDDGPHCVDDLPIACISSDFLTRCSTPQLTAAARELFMQVGMDSRQLAYIDSELSNNEYPEIREKDPTAYLFRRNFATHLHILGITDAEIRYIIAHDIGDPYETRNEFVNEERLYQIKLKLDQRPIFNNTSQNVEAVTDLKNTHSVLFEGHYLQKLQIPLSSGTVHLHLSACEPGDRIRLSWKFNSLSAKFKTVKFPTQSLSKYDRTINILKEYHDSYLKEAAKSHSKYATP
jgi:hypothetical protein